MGLPRFRFTDPGRAALKKAVRAAIVIPAVFAFADKVLQQPESTISRGLRLFRSAGAGGLPRTHRGGDSSPISPSSWRARCSSPRDAVLAERVARRRRHGCGRLRGPVLERDQPVLRDGGMGAPAHVRPAGHPARRALSHSHAPRGVGSGLRRRDPSGDAVVAAAAPLRSARGRGPGLPNAWPGWWRPSWTGIPALIDERAGAARADVAAVRWTFASTPYRPTGATGSTEALAFLVDALEWFLSIALPAGTAPRSAPGRARRRTERCWPPCSSALQDSAATLEGRDERPDLDRLDAARDAMAEALATDIAQRPAGREDGHSCPRSEPSFRRREMSVGRAARSV